MKLKDILACVDGKLVCGESHLEDEVMRGILEDDIILITGLSNNQAIRTAEMSDISNILLVRNKKPSQSMIDMANELNISLSYTSFSLFKASGLLYEQGLKPVY